MLTKLEYLKEAVKQVSPLERKDWYIYAFALPVLKDRPDWKDVLQHRYELIAMSDGLYYLDYNDEGKILSKIVDYVKGEPLFNPQTKIEVDNSWLSSIDGKIETKIGTLIVNTVAFHSVVGNRLPYINKERPSIGEIENIISTRTKNDADKTDKDISVNEMTACLDNLNFFMCVSGILNIAATRKAITPPPGIEKKKEELKKEYGESLKDPVKFVEFENRLREIDKEYLKDDPAAKAIFNKKSVTGRTKMFLTYGSTLDFEEDPVNNKVISSLSEGFPTDPKEYAKLMNDLRFGSFARGSSTALSGYAYKILQRSLSGVTVSPVACNTTKGFKRLITKENSKNMVNRYIKDKGWTLIKDKSQAETYIGKEVEFRSTVGCTSPGNTVCFACMSDNYKTQPNGISTLASSMSTVLMITFLKLNHGVTTELVDISVDDLVT